MTLLCIIRGPNKELRRESVGLKWCFGDRQHLEHDAVLLGDEGPSYYDPVWVFQCSKCGKDRTEFGS